jgi:hypothetical protein
LIDPNLGNKGAKLGPPVTEDDDDQDVPEIASSRQHFEAYFTEQGLKEMTGYHNKADWYLLTLKENFDNAIDFHWKKYPWGTAKVTAKIILDDSRALFHCSVKNSIPANKPTQLLTDLDNILAPLFLLNIHIYVYILLQFAITKAWLMLMGYY